MNKTLPSTPRLDAEKLVRLHTSRVEERFPRVHLISPAPSGYLLLAAEIDRRPWWFFPASSVKRALLRRIKAQCALLATLPGVLSAVSFRAFLGAPGGHSGYLKRRRDPAHRARFDITILIETDSPARMAEVQRTREFQELEADLRSTACYTEIIEARNVKRMGNVDHSVDGVFLFNFFVADDVQQNLGVWEYTAGWFEQETHLDNSTVLLPSSPTVTSYSCINHCRWDHLSDVLPALLFKPSFHSYVLAHFNANNTAPMPIFYRLA